MIIALMFYEKDQVQAMGLARLLADLEQAETKDSTLLLITQPTLEASKDVIETVAYCNSKIETVFENSELGGEGWLDGSSQLWSGALRSAVKMGKDDSVFLVDGGDSCPLKLNWLESLKNRHSKTRELGKNVTGYLAKLNDQPFFVHSNCIIDIDFIKSNPSLMNSKKRSEGILQNFEGQHFLVLSSSLSPCHEIWAEPHKEGLCLEVVRKLAGVGCVWLHGYKDTGLVPMARQFLLGT